MPSITVSLNIKDDPQVSCDPPQCPVDNGNHKIKWKHGGSTDFTFDSIEDLPSSTFSTPQADDPAHPDWFICTDTNQKSETYSYTVWVLDSDGNRHSTQKTSEGGGDSVPCIKNN